MTEIQNIPIADDVFDELASIAINARQAVEEVAAVALERGVEELSFRWADEEMLHV